MHYDSGCFARAQLASTVSSQSWNIWSSSKEPSPEEMTKSPITDSALMKKMLVASLSLHASPARSASRRPTHMPAALVKWAKSVSKIQEACMCGLWRSGIAN